MQLNMRKFVRWSRAALRYVILRVPFLNTLLHFPIGTHRKVGTKFIVLWVFSIVPLIYAALDHQIIRGKSHFGSLKTNLQLEFSATNLFVYSVSFLVPLFYLLFEKYRNSEQFIFSRKKAPPDLALPPGFGFILVIAFLVYTFTAISYKNASIASSSSTYAQSYAVKYAAWVYFYAMYCWYISMLVNHDPSANTDFTAAMRADEKSFTDALSDRLKKNKGGA